MKKIIFVCTGGTCRSPMAENMLKSKLRQLGISGKEVSVSSAGIMANKDDYISEKTIDVLKDHGVLVIKKKSNQISKRMVNKNTILIALTDSHKDWIKNIGKVYSLSDFVAGLNISDPHGKGVEYYEKVYQELLTVIDIIANNIKTGKI